MIGTDMKLIAIWQTGQIVIKRQLLDVSAGLLTLKRQCTQVNTGIDQLLMQQ